MRHPSGGFRSFQNFLRSSPETFFGREVYYAVRTIFLSLLDLFACFLGVSFGFDRADVRTVLLLPVEYPSQQRYDGSRQRETSDYVLTPKAAAGSFGSLDRRLSAWKD